MNFGHFGRKQNYCVNEPIQYDWKLGEKCSKRSQLPIIPTPEQNKMYDFSKKT
jgi:hypothetical protein